MGYGNQVAGIAAGYAVQEGIINIFSFFPAFVAAVWTWDAFGQTCTGTIVGAAVLGAGEVICASLWAQSRVIAIILYIAAFLPFLSILLRFWLWGHPE